MIFNLSKVKTNSWFLISAIIITVSFYLFYFEYYVKNSEERIITAHFRALDQVGKNIDKKLNVYIHNAKNLESKVNAEWKNIIKGKEENISTLKLKQNLIDTLNKKGDLNKNLKVVNFITDDDLNRKLNELKRKSSTQNYCFAISLNSPPFSVESENRSALMVFEMSYNKLIEGLVREDVFDGLIIVRDTSIIYNTLEQQFVFQPHSDNNKDKHNNSINHPLLHMGTIMSGEVFDMSVSNISHKAFLKPFKVNNDTWFAIGLIKTKNFNAASRSIEPWIIISLSMLLIFIILGLPVIKLKVLSKTEQLDTKNIIDYALFVMLGGAFLAMSTSFLALNNTHQQNINKKLLMLSDTIYSSFKKEISEAYLQLDYYDSNYDSMKIPDTTNHANIYNTKVKIDILSADAPFKPTHYPYGDYYFWTNKKGVQTAYLTPINTYGKLSDLSSRDYINKKDEWFFPGSTNEKFRLQSIVSITSGTVKAAISKKGTNSEQRPVVAVSTKMYSIINTILPMNYSFCIIDKTGKVWFHSDQNLNLKENFIEECDENKYLKAAMYANISKSMNVKYYNHPYRIHIKHLDNLPLYLITMSNKKLVKSVQAEAITFTLLFVSIALFVIFLQILALLIIEVHLKHIFSRNILIKLTRPIIRLNDRYVYLIKLNLILSLATIIFMNFYSNMAAITSILSITIILFTYSYWLLNNNETKEVHKRWFSAFNTILFLIVTVTGIYITPTNEIWQIILFDIVTIFIIAIAHKYLKKETTNNSHYWTNYTWLLVTILILMGVIPTLKFYETGYNNESEIRTKHKLLDLMNKREQRNTKIISFYNKVNVSEKRDSIIMKRKELGVYIHFDDTTKYLNQWDSENQDSLLDNNHWDTLYCYIRPFYDKYIIENKYLPISNSSSDNILWFKTKNRLTLKYNSLTEQINQDSIKPYYISSTIPQINFITPLRHINNSTSNIIFLAIVFWLTIALIIYIFFRLLKFGIHRIFSHDIIQNFFYQGFGERLQQFLSVNRNIFIVRLSQSDQTDIFYNDYLSEDGRLLIDWTNRVNIKNTLNIIDDFMEQLRNESNNTNNVEILIAGFDHEYIEPSLLKEKLDVIKLLLNRKDIKLIITSQVSTATITKYYQTLITELKKNSENRGKQTIAKIEEYRNVINKLNHTIKIFITTYLPVRYCYPESFEDKYHNDKPVILNKEAIIKNELDASDFLMQFKPALMKLSETCCNKFGQDFPAELLIEKIYTLAERYYEDIFNNCSSEEKYILLDIGHDLIINPKNEQAIYSLLKKGILVRKCYKINLMNKSFLKFLVTKLHLAKELEAELNKGRDTGTWQGYKITLILIIISLFAFITMANQDFLDNLNRLFVAIGGGIAVITGIVGLLSHKRKMAKE